MVSVEYFGARLAYLPFPPKKSANGDGTATRSARKRRVVVVVVVSSGAGAAAGVVGAGCSLFAAGFFSEA